MHIAQLVNSSSSARHRVESRKLLEAQYRLSRICVIARWILRGLPLVGRRRWTSWTDSNTAAVTNHLKLRK
ncbi:hypothetical protein SCLCIDRAFT_1217029, partial [Scleroderma citrinum Foug A]